jgi:hypothetical protein
LTSVVARRTARLRTGSCERVNPRVPEAQPADGSCGRNRTGRSAASDRRVATTACALLLVAQSNNGAYTRQVDADTALMRAYNLGMDDAGWTDAVMDEAEELLPTLLEAGYAASDDEAGTWWFTAEGVARAEELERDGCA